MHQVPDDVFNRFTIQRRKDLARIARHTRGEHQFEDVVNEAWVMASTLLTADGEPLDLAHAAGQHTLISYLYQHLVRYTDLNVRQAVRLDHKPGGDEQDGDVHPLTYLLVSNDGHDALSELIDQETASALENELAAHGSLAAAYVRLLRHFDNRMSAVAEHLKVSRSHAYRRCAQAMRYAIEASHIPIPLPNERFVPGPWRRFWLLRQPVQLTFDFNEQLLCLPSSLPSAASSQGTPA
ncbi:MAG: hypothetical protein ACOZE7_16570 [Pseudomonadota bacterium]|jgi:hypothetical protein